MTDRTRPIEREPAPSHLSVATDDDAPRRRAAERLAKAIAHVRSIGGKPTTALSADSPYGAVRTYLLEHQVDHIVLATTTGGHWSEQRLVDRLRSLTAATIEVLPVVKR